MIPDDERVGAFVREDRDIVAAHAHAKWTRFQAKLKDGVYCASVCRESAGREVLIAAGEASMRGSDVFAGFAWIGAGVVREKTLDVEETPGEYDGHSDILGWPPGEEDEERRYLLALDLARASQLDTVPHAQRSRN